MTKATTSWCNLENFLSSYDAVKGVPCGTAPLIADRQMGRRGDARNETRHSVLVDSSAVTIKRGFHEHRFSRITAYKEKNLLIRKSIELHFGKEIRRRSLGNP